MLLNYQICPRRHSKRAPLGRTRDLSEWLKTAQNAPHNPLKKSKKINISLFVKGEKGTFSARVQGGEKKRR
jgi:hypothetical protein